MSFKLSPGFVTDFVGAPLAGAQRQDTHKGYPYNNFYSEIDGH